MDGSPCNNDEAYCLSGECKTYNAQCQTHFLTSKLQLHAKLEHHIYNMVYALLHIQTKVVMNALTSIIQGEMSLETVVQMELTLFLAILGTFKYLYSAI